MSARRGCHHEDDGFTLVELLVVIIVLGVLATITVLAVRGIVDQGEESAEGADEHTLVTAEEAHQARFDSYASESDLVTAGLLSGESVSHDIAVDTDGSGYTIVPAGSITTVPSTPTTPTTPPTVPPTVPPTLPPGPTPLRPVTVAGFSGQAFGSGPNRIVIISDGTSFLGNWNTIKAGTPLPTTEIVWLGAGDIDSIADVNAIVATNPTYLVAASSVPIGSTFVGQYLSTNRASPAQFWWGHQQGGLMLMVDYYTTHIVIGG